MTKSKMNVGKSKDQHGSQGGKTVGKDGKPQPTSK
jgi:hypothetical protein